MTANDGIAPSPPTFADCRANAANWVTLASGEYYPDILNDAKELYKPVLVTFNQILRKSESSRNLFLNIADVKEGWMRVQLCRVFKKYVSPDTPVEMLKVKSRAKDICNNFGEKFRPIHEVQAAFSSRPIPDEALCAVLWEYKDRGKKGYDLTEKFFSLFREKFPNYSLVGPERAGRDIPLGELFQDYPNPTRPVDFVIYGEDKKTVIGIGLARYDSDRGGAQEDDRTGGYKNCADEILNYADEKGLNIKVIFVNDGPGLLLGSMWSDYAALEQRWTGKILVVTLRMVPERLTAAWLTS